MAVRADVVVFSVGALLFATGLVGIYALPDEGGSSFNTFTVTWDEQSRTVDVHSLQLLDGEELDESFNLSEEDAADATVITFEIDCTDNAVGADVAPASLAVTLTGPGNLTADASGQCGDILTAQVRVQDAPTAEQAAGESEDDATQRLLNDRATSLAVGDWTASYTLTRDGSLPDLTGTGSADVEVTAVITYFTPQLTALPR